MMDKAQTIAEVRKRIGEAEVEKALQLMLSFLEKSPSYLNLHSDALQALAQYRKTRKEEAQGLISYDEAKRSHNQVVNQVLNILEDLQREEQLQPFRRRWPLWAGAGAVVVLGIFAVWFFAIRDAGAVPCPDFKPESQFNILIWPYQPLNKNTTSLPQIPIMQNLENLGRKYKIDICPRILTRDEAFPAGQAEAELQGEKCEVKLVIWGTVEDRNDGTTILVTNYKFLELGDNFSFRKLRMNENMDLDTVSALSTITTNGFVEGEIEDAIKYLFGIVAHETNQPKALIEELTAAAITDSAAALSKQMFLADAFIQLDDTLGAEAAYDTILTSIHTNYGFALDNRASIYLSKGKYEAAVADLTKHLEGLPATATGKRDTLLELRAEANLRAQRLEQAKADLQEIRERRPDNPLIRQRLEEVQKRIDKENEKKIEAEKQLLRDPGNTAALTTKADASRKIGDYAAAIDAADALLKRDPTNLTAIRALLESYQALGDEEKAQAVITRARQAGVSIDTLRRMAPNLLPKPKMRVIK